MAVRHGYGKVAGADALVFAYDTGDTRNSYRGRPTTNYGPADFGDWGTESTAERIATGNTYKGQPTYNCRTVVGESWRGVEKTISGLRTAAGSSGTVTMSCMVRNNNPSAYNMYAYIGHDFGSTRTIAANSDWQKVQWTVNQSSMNNDYVEFRPYTNNASIYLEMTMPMVEVNVGNASQFVNGTRSATQGLLDLTGNRPIDLSNVSFDSNAQVVYDGTDDGIAVADTINLSSYSALTIEGVYTGAGVTSLDRWFSGTSGTGYHYPDLAMNSSGQQWYIFSSIIGSWTNTGVSLPTNKYNHIVYTFTTAGAVEMYANGELVYTATHSAGTFPSVSRAMIGNRYDRNGEALVGSIPVVKMYSRKLTASEVLNNFNSYKSRFNL